MTAVIKEKLEEIEERARYLLEGKGFPPEVSLEQQFSWIQGCIGAIEIQAGQLMQRSQCLLQIEQAIDGGGDPAFILKRIQAIVKEARGLWHA